MKLPVTEIQRFCMHDGDGVRTVVFLKGCPLRCKWCHNPETQKAEQEMLYYSAKCIACGACELICHNGAHSFTDHHCYDRSLCISCEKCAKACPTEAIAPAMREKYVDEIVREIERDMAFYGDNGGVTLSGGEPLIHGEAAIELLKKCKEKNISTAVETCGYISSDNLREAIKYTDLFLWDIKDTNNERHKEYTGVSNQRIIENLLLADSLGAKTVMRCIIVNGVNTDAAHIEALAALWQRLSNCRYIELIPYHAYGGSKMLSLGKEDNGRKEWIPEHNQIEEIKKKFRPLGVTLKQ